MDFNPFPIQGYHGAVYFCDRKEESKRLISALKNQRNITLISARRLGKSTLIKHVFASLKGVKTAYVDLYRTRDQAQMTEKLTTEIIAQIGRPNRPFLQKVAAAIPAIDLGVGFDPVTGQPDLGISLRSREKPAIALKQLFAFLESMDKRVFIAIDEFQEVVNYPENNTEALLREYIQTLNNVNFIFSGSNHRMMHAIFSSYNRPFYQSTDSLHLEKIPESLYLKFIGKHFRAAGKRINDEEILTAMRWCRGYTFFVQFLFNYLYSIDTKEYGIMHIRQTQEDILGARSREYHTLSKLLSDHQYSLLRAIAIEEHVASPTAKEFIRAHDLSTTSTVAQSLKALLKKELIHEEDEGYIVTDVFLSRWAASDI